MSSWEDEPLAELAKRPLTKEEIKAVNQLSWDVPVRYLDHVPFAKMEGNRLVAPPRPSPYANIIVQPLGSSETAFIQIAHKMDFYNLWLLEVQRVLDRRRFDVIIRHKRPSGLKKLLASVLPHLEYSVFYSGYFDEARNQLEIEVLLENEPYMYLYDQDRRGLPDWVMDFTPHI
jgi:hypothetical protein